MKDSENYLTFSNLETGRPVVAFCSMCGERFVAAPDPSKRTDDLILTVRAEFNAHNCSRRPV